MIFVDSGGWFALSVPIDPDHQRAVNWIADRTDPLVTTDYVIDETLTLLRARGEHKRAMKLGEDFFERSAAVIYKITDADLHAAWQIFREYKDKDMELHRLHQQGRHRNSEYHLSPCLR